MVALESRKRLSCGLADQRSAKATHAHKSAALPFPVRRSGERNIHLLILIIILVLVLGGGGGYYGHSRWGYGGGAGIGLGTILLILLVAYMLGIFH
jgi:hypothetical protein